MGRWLLSAHAAIRDCAFPRCLRLGSAEGLAVRDAGEDCLRPETSITHFPIGPKCARASAPSTSGPPRVAV